MQAENLPDPLLRALQHLVNIEFPNQNEFETALQHIIDAVRDEFNQYQSLIIKAAEVPRTYTLTEKSLKILKEKGLPDNLLGKMENLKDKTCADRTEFITQIKPIIEESIGEKAAIGINSTEELEAQRKKAKKIIELYKKYQALILEQVEILPGYRLTDQTYKNVPGMPL